MVLTATGGCGGTAPNHDGVAQVGGGSVRSNVTRKQPASEQRAARTTHPSRTSHRSYHASQGPPAHPRQRGVAHSQHPQRPRNDGNANRARHIPSPHAPEQGRVPTSAATSTPHDANSQGNPGRPTAHVPTPSHPTQGR